MAKQLLRSIERLRLMADSNRALGAQIAELRKLRQAVQAAEGAASRKAAVALPRDHLSCVPRARRGICD
jgi:hypothetical protein